MRRPPKKRGPTGSPVQPYMRGKLVLLFVLILIVFTVLVLRVNWIGRNNKDEYSRQVLSQQRYDSRTLPCRRGNIVDRNGTVLATSEKVYNLVIDTKVMNTKDGIYVEPTLEALREYFPQLDITAIRSYMAAHPDSGYYVPAKKLHYTEIADFVDCQNDTATDEDGNPGPGNSIKGVWFEEEYVRTYPNGSLACDVIGFTSSDGAGLCGLEEYYDSTLSGTPGREFGYLNTDSTLERTTKPAVDGYTIVSTLDVNIQSIVERYISEYVAEYTDYYKPGPAANNIGVIVEDVDSAEILAMASSDSFDLNNPYDLSAYYTDEMVEQMKADDTYWSTLNGLWRNFCVSDTYEPGSTYKPFTEAMGLETGKLNVNDTFNCEGSLTLIDGQPAVHCHNRFGDGTVSMERALAVSCNVALMKMGITIGSRTFAEYQRDFGFGLKTNIDLPGEARTQGLVHDDTMGITELATGAFGQGFNVSMIQMINAYCALIGGGQMHEPHLVRQILSGSGAVVDSISAKLVGQPVSADTSATIRQYSLAVCDPSVDGNTGRRARPAGYRIGGKTGTAETLPRGNHEYVVSFEGFAPVDDPKVAIYIVIDRPNLPDQTSGTRQACVMAREILTEILPYLGIFMTEDLTDDEAQELAAKQLEDTRKYKQPKPETTVSDTEGESRPWMAFPIDPNTGYRVDPDTGESYDAETGYAIVEGGYNSLSE